MGKIITAIILAAGKGKRMKSELPKVMHVLKGKPLVEYVVGAVERAKFGKPVVVIGARHNGVEKYLGCRAKYAVQNKQFGTGHAVAAAATAASLKGKVKNIMVLYGDMPFVSSRSIKKLFTVHQAKKNVLTMMTVKLPNFLGWRKQFIDFGRVVRYGEGKVAGIIERKDASKRQKLITEVNPGFYCFRSGWLWKNLKKLKNNNAQREYYLTDLIKLAILAKERVGTTIINPKEAVGVNTKEQLVYATKLLI